MKYFANFRKIFNIKVLFFFVVYLIFPNVSARTEEGQLGKTVEIEPVGIYTTIDVHVANETIDIFYKGNSDEILKRAIEILRAPENYAPIVFYVFSNFLFNEDKKDEAVFWFYAGQLRTTFDANRCTDPSAAGAVDVLNQRFGPIINPYALKDLDKLEKIITKVIEWDKKTPHNYDQRWINLHGMEAMSASLNKNSSNDKPLNFPQDQWDTIAEKTRDDYLKGFHWALEQLRNKNTGVGPSEKKEDEKNQVDTHKAEYSGKEVTIKLKTGKVIEGKMLDKNDNSVSVDVKGVNYRVPFNMMDEASQSAMKALSSIKEKEE